MEIKCKFLEQLNSDYKLTKEDISFVAQIAKEQIKFMIRNNIPLLPTNYRNWFIVFCYLFENKQSFTDIDAVSIYKNFFEENCCDDKIESFKSQLQMQKLEKIADKISEDLEMVVKLIEQGDINIENSQKVIEKEWNNANIEKIGENVEKILEELRFLREQNKELKEKLESYNHEIKKLKDELIEAKTEANIDFLTGLPNRRSFIRALEDYFNLLKEKGIDFSIILFDIDNFKNTNDTYGHDAGDLVLKDVAAVLKFYLRANTISGRLGGEEFGILIPAKLEDAVKVAERIRKVMENREIRYQDKIIKYTASFGITQAKKDDTIDTLLKRADELLYKAKRSGKNIVIADG